MHPRSKHWHLLDYVPMRQRGLKDIFHTKVMPSVECCTDHRFVRCKHKLQFKLEMKEDSIMKLNVSSLCQEDVKAKIQADIQQKLVISPCNDVPTKDTLWDNLKSAILKTPADDLGYIKKKNQDWFDKEIQDFLTEKRVAFQSHLPQPIRPVRKATFRRVCSTLQRKHR